MHCDGKTVANSTTVNPSGYTIMCTLMHKVYVRGHTTTYTDDAFSFEKSKKKTSTTPFD